MKTTACGGWCGIYRFVYCPLFGAADCNTAFDELVFATKPFYDGRPWFMSTVLNWHRLLDKFKL